MNSTNRTSLLLTLFVFAALVLSVLILLWIEDNKLRASLRTTPEDTLLTTREVYSWIDDPIRNEVSYAYFGETLPEKLYEDELVDRRTEKMVQRFVRQIDKDHREIQVLINALEVRAKDSTGVWKNLERATTTMDAFRKRPISFVEKYMAFLLPTARAFTPAAGTGYTTKNIITLAGGCGPALASAKTAPADTANTGSGHSLTSVSDVPGPNGCDASFYITFLPFDTSAIPSGFPITSAALSITITSATDVLGNGNVFTLATSTQASHSSLAATDHASYCAGAGAGCRTNTIATDLVAFDSGGPTSFTHAFDFEVTALGAIKRSGEASTCSATNGITCLVVRPPGVLAVGDGIADTNSIIFGTGNAVLSSNFIESTFVFWQFQDY